MSLLEQERLTQVIREKGVENEIKAALEIRFQDKVDVYVFLKNFKQLIDTVEENGSRIILLDFNLLEDDVSDSTIGEMIAVKLLLPHEVIAGEEELRRLKTTYAKNIVRQVLKSLIAERKLASLQLVIKPEYFLFEKLRRLSGVSLPIREEIARLLKNMQEPLASRFNEAMGIFRQAAEELVGEGILSSDGQFLTITENAINQTKMLTSIKVEKIEERIKKLVARPARITAVIKLFMDNIMRNVNFPAMVQSLMLPDPNEYIYLRTGVGLQPLNEQYDIVDFAKRFYGDAEFKVRKIGKALNSTYQLTIRTKEDKEIVFFVKKYLNWTDIKWIIARVWALGVRNFSLMADTRMANEIYFINLLREIGFNTAEIIHVNWRGHTIYQRFITGKTLLDAWIENSDNKEKIAYGVGKLLSEIHSHNIVIGDCKPENFIIEEKNNQMYVIDLEQASKKGDKTWDITELIFYSGHYLESRTSAEMAENIVRGYLEKGDYEVVRKALKPKYLRVLTPWTPIWVQRHIVERLRSILGA